jgi:hypothetical protein
VSWEMHIVELVGIDFTRYPNLFVGPLPIMLF